MNAKKFSEALGEVDQSYLEEAVSYHRADRPFRRTRRLPAALTAAMLALLLIGCVAAAAGVFGTRLTGLFTSRTESGYDLSVAIERIPTQDLSEELLAVGATIQRQFETYQPHQSWYPGHWQRDFPSHGEACRFIGVDLSAPAEWAQEEQQTTLNVHGTVSGQILQVNLETDYVVDGIRISLFSSLYTENYEGEITFGVRAAEDVTFEEFFYTTSSNLPCQVIASSALDSGYLSLDGYLVDSGVLYNLHIVYQDGEFPQAEAILRQWADSF